VGSDAILPSQGDDDDPRLTGYMSRPFGQPGGWRDTTPADDTATAGEDASEPPDPAVAAAGDRLVDLNRPPSQYEPSVTVVVPTRNEEQNMGALLQRLAPALGGLSAEIIVVDDSDDATCSALAASAKACPVLVRLLHRQPASRKGGLSTAVIAGARSARGEWVLVMDADLQHPPEIAARLADTAIRHECDVIAGTRYGGRGPSGAGLDGRGRRMVSSWTTRLVKSLFPRRLANVSDPLSGLFAFRRAAVDLDRLRPVGFKILLEILVRSPAARVAEVAYCFSVRNAGESKASLRQGLTFLRHVSRLRWSRLATQLRQGPTTRHGRFLQVLRFSGFGLIGVTGIGVNTAALWLFYGILGWHQLTGAALATQVSTAWNFVLIDILIYRGRSNGTRFGRVIRFAGMNNLLLLARLPLFQALVVRGFPVLVANAITLALLFLIRFVLSDRAIFGTPAQERSRDPVRLLIDLIDPATLRRGGKHASGRRPAYLAYRYDVAGVVTIGSQIMLPELEFFRAQWIPGSDVDIAVRVGDVGSWTPRHRAAMTESNDPTVIRYEEHLGRFGANFRATLGDDRITVEVGPLLACSCHVVYTNVVEPLLRFVMVTRGRMLLHSACVELDRTGVMLSARTDTGKTGTVLRLLRERGARFLSDDMTVIDAYGGACCFPKPLTISAHTLRAVHTTDLTRSERLRLQIQSHLHSKGGRSLGMLLSHFNLPIMSINALTQMLIPPPKYSADRLVRCRMTSAVRVRDMFIIERGPYRLADVDHSAALEQLIANTDDAYGFPPFRYLAPAIAIGGRDYRQLRQAERDILDGFLAHVRVRVLASDSFGWADDIASLVDANTGRAADLASASKSSLQAEADVWPCWADALAFGEGA
jgi:dolichol-phosphate mannosyltransferase